jgi:hypothetical protein
VNTILAIAVGLVINGIIAFGIAKISKSLWMVAGLTIVFKAIEVVSGHFLGIQNIASVGAWAVTLITGFLFFMITVQIYTFLRERAEENEAEALESSKV